jgi:hypothetical protein
MAKNEAKAEDSQAKTDEPKAKKKESKAKSEDSQATTEAPKGKGAAKAEQPRPPADPRLKLLKKFHGKFLPKGVLRQRHQAIMTRWNSGEDHGGVTVEELKSLLDDWRGTREKPPRKVPT